MTRPCYCLAELAIIRTVHDGHCCRAEPECGHSGDVEGRAYALAGGLDAYESASLRTRYDLLREAVNECQESHGG